MQFDPHSYPYPSKRNVMYARKGMVATSQPLAAQAGLEILKAGGNAVDAAVATAAALTVVEPTSNGIGGDAFALVWMKKELHGLNASGPAPQELTIEAVQKAGFEQIPETGVIPVTIPGAPSAWAELTNRFGKLTLEENLQPAIQLAEEGFPVSPTAAEFWQEAVDTYKKKHTSDEFEAWFSTFAPGGRAPLAGELWRSVDHANTLREIAKTNSSSFYNGKIADKIHSFFKLHGGYLSKKDLSVYRPEWVTPIQTTYKGYDIWEIPPNGQGLTALMALSTLRNDTFNAKDSAETLHLQIEAMKLAFADGLQYITEEKDMSVSSNDLLDSGYADQRRKTITDTAQYPKHGEPQKGGTVYLATADKDGNMVSFIQSNYMGFGSGIVIPGTGIAMQNRGHNFSLKEADANVLRPGKRTYHTIIPGFVTRKKEAVGPFGVMGGFMQPQGHLQVIMNSIDFNLNPQASLDAPRWLWKKGVDVEVDPLFPQYLIESLAKRGHKITRASNHNEFGRGQIIWRDPLSGVLSGGTESRTDGCIASW